MVVVELMVALARAECGSGAPVGVSGLDQELLKAEGAFVDLDIEGFLATSDRIRAELPCMNEVVPPTVAARLHRVEGLRRFGERDVDDVRAFAAARAADPQATLPPEMAPPGSQLLADFGAMDTSAGDVVPLAEPIEAVLWLDGQVATTRNVGRPTLAQLVGVDGGVRWTSYVAHAAPLPPYEAIPLPEPEPPPLPEPVTVVVHRSPRIPLAIATAATVVAAGVTYGVGASSRSAWLDPETPDADLAGLKATTNTMAVVSTASGVAALGLGTLLVVTW